VCGAPDALWVIQLLGERQMMTPDELCQEMKGLNQNQILAAVTLLIEDNIMILNGKNYRLSPLGKSLLPAVKELLPTINDKEMFNFATYLLTEATDNFEEDILPFTNNVNPRIRLTAYYTLGKSQKKEQYLDTFIKGLQETDNDVLRTVIQAISGVKDERLLPYYKQIAKRFSKDEDYILSNLKRALEPFGLTVEEARK